MAIDTIGTNAIANDAVTAAKIPAGAVDADITAIPDGSVTTAKIADNAVTSAKALNLGRRNLAINGGMQVAQRATSVSSISSGGSYHTCDRWRLAIDTSGTWTQTQETLAVTDPPFVQHGHTKALKMDCTTANGSLSAGSYIQLQYRIEGHDLQRLRTGTSSPAPVTISFWVKATKTGTNIVNVFQDEGGKQVAFSYTINASNTWEHKSITIPGNTHDAINNDNTRGRQFTWYLSAGSNRTSGSLQSTWQNYATGDEAVGQVNHADNTANNFHITGVQIEQGSSATDFEHRSFGEELLLCQRYYEHTYPYGTAAGSANGGIGADHRYVGRSTGNNYGYFTGHYRVEKRAAATVTVYSYVGTANQIAHGDTGSDSGAVGVIQNGTTSFLPRNTSGSGVSERALLYHFRADAEL